MGNPSELWWGYAKKMVKAYRKREAEYIALRASTGDPAAVLPGSHQKEYDAVKQAIELMRCRKNGKEKLAVIEMVLITGSKTLEGAANKLYISFSTARRYHREFLFLVAECFGMGVESKQ